MSYAGASGARHSGVDLGIDGIGEATRVGQGGFGVVYRARQEAFDRTVAVKVLLAPALDDLALRRFEQECRAVGSLSGHPHIVSVYGSGYTAGGQPFLLMDYLPGGTLARRLKRDGPVDPTEVADTGVKLAGALASACAAGVLHRDLKPENVLISTYGQPQITDFGVARIQGGTETRSGVITGSLAHAAPEVLSGRPATEASDVYSLASTLFALATGVAPFSRPDDETFHPMIARILSEDPPDLRPQGVPNALCEVLEKSLVKDPGARIPTAMALGEALREAQRAAGWQLTPLVSPAIAKPVNADGVSPAAEPTSPGRLNRDELAAPSLGEEMERPTATSPRAWSTPDSPPVGTAVVEGVTLRRERLWLPTPIAEGSTSSPPRVARTLTDGRKPWAGRQRLWMAASAVVLVVAVTVPIALTRPGNDKTESVVIADTPPATETTTGLGPATTATAAAAGPIGGVAAPTIVPRGRDPVSPPSSLGLVPSPASGGAPSASTAPPTSTTAGPSQTAAIPSSLVPPSCSLGYGVWGDMVSGTGFAITIEPREWVMQSFSNMTGFLAWAEVNVGGSGRINTKVYRRASGHTTGDFQELIPGGVDTTIDSNRSTHVELNVNLGSLQTWYLQLYNPNANSVTVYFQKGNPFPSGSPETSRGFLPDGDMNARVCMR